MEVPATHYAVTAQGESVAYQVVGNGPFDLVFVPGFISHVELLWAEPSIARFYERMASYSRLILFDKRGTGLSDPIPGPQPLEERMQDVQAVLDAVGSERAALVGLSEEARWLPCSRRHTRSERSPSYSAARSGAARRSGIPPGSGGSRPAGVSRRRSRGDGSALSLLGPSSGATARQRGLLERAGASPRMAQALIAMWLEIDLGDVLPSISVPTLVLNRAEEIFRPRRRASWPHASQALGTWSFLASITSPGPATRGPTSRRSRNS